MAPAVDINYLAVLVSAAVSMGIGFLWYGPLFGNQWKKLAGFTDKSIKQMKMTPMQSMIFGFITTLVMAYIFAHFVGYAQAATAADGVILGFWVWLGFFATTQLGMVLWENKPLKLYFLNTLHYLVALAVMGAILAIWI